MVYRARQVVWSINAQNTRKSVFYYWNNRNKSNLYSRKLKIIFNETLDRIALVPDASLKTNSTNVR